MEAPRRDIFQIPENRFAAMRRNPVAARKYFTLYFLKQLNATSHNVYSIYFLQGERYARVRDGLE
jgi:hypothetical protein